MAPPFPRLAAGLDWIHQGEANWGAPADAEWLLPVLVSGLKTYSSIRVLSIVVRMLAW